ncbi:DUF2865 domain-containing protein [Segnochrobactrum spirostomi]|uniref:DUF2865 domain-containing protein n=1 Tax=Segnochrobactrum spirostomi TaxID=2608987 RepID=A0A6A7XZR6_9HYPH|nr:DUF2865 domain-containing protein [Segnochrobactrum spirostomi]MQT11229.1 DUF2865 domain-containing protein [Segnochrobactrum spirostomi]
MTIIGCRPPRRGLSVWRGWQRRTIRVSTREMRAYAFRAAGRSVERMAMARKMWAGLAVAVVASLGAVCPNAASADACSALQAQINAANASGDLRRAAALSGQMAACHNPKGTHASKGKKVATEAKAPPVQQASAGNPIQNFFGMLFGQKPAEAPQAEPPATKRSRTTQRRPETALSAPVGSGPAHLLSTKKEKDEPKESFRTLCVRTCDGYFFPISPSTARENFARDAEACHAYCPASEVKLYIQPAGQPSDPMVSEDGQPYGKLPSAYLFRTISKPGCTCALPENGASATAAEKNPVGTPEGAAPLVPVVTITPANLDTGTPAAPVTAKSTTAPASAPAASAAPAVASQPATAPATSAPLRIRTVGPTYLQNP